MPFTAPLTGNNSYPSPSRFLILPALAGLGVIVLVPFVHMIVLSVSNYDLSGGSGSASFVGIENFKQALAGDALFRNSILVSLRFSFLSLSIELFVGFLLALWLSRNRSVARLLLPIVLIPSLIPPIVVALVWSFLLQSTYGPLIWLTHQLGFVEASSPFSSLSFALPALVFVDVWQWTPFVAVILFAGMAVIPKRLVEVAIVDGATSWQLIRTVYIPQLFPTILAVTIIRLIDLMREFDKPFILTGGGPSTATELISLYIWRIGFRQWNVGYAAALSLIVYALTIFVCGLLFVVRRRSGYGKTI